MRLLGRAAGGVRGWRLCPEARAAGGARRACRPLLWHWLVCEPREHTPHLSLVSEPNAHSEQSVAGTLLTAVPHVQAHVTELPLLEQSFEVHFQSPEAHEYGESGPDAEPT